MSTFRIMLEEGSMPKVGCNKNELGVREGIDVKPVSGNVRPKTGGMSVNGDRNKIPTPLIPKRLGHVYVGATGRDDVKIWKMDLEFKDSGIDETLTLRVDKPKQSHGLIEPSKEMKLSDLQTAIASTKTKWNIDES